MLENEAVPSLSDVSRMLLVWSFGGVAGDAGIVAAFRELLSPFNKARLCTSAWLTWGVGTGGTGVVGPADLATTVEA